MRHSWKMQQQRLGGRGTWFVCLLMCLALLGAFWGCGKLSDDTGQSSSPTGTSSAGTSIDFNITSTAGTYELALAASPTSIEADMNNYSILTATLSDSAERTVGGYGVVFLTSANLGYFYNDSDGWTTSASAYTDSDGEATIRLYGGESGEETVIAAIDMDGDDEYDIKAEISMTFTSASSASCAGNYCIEVGANPTTIPADNATYSTVYATVTDSSGGSVEDLTITFESELGYLNNQPTSGSTSTTETGLTGETGSVSMYYYADRAGSATITARVSIPDLPNELVDTTKITVTEAAGVPGDETPGLYLTVDPESQEQDGDSNTGTSETDDIVLTATVWDSTGDLAGAGVQVEFTGDIEGFAYTDSSGVATLTKNMGSLGVGSHTFTVEACTYSILPDQEQYCDDVSFGVTVYPPDLEVVVSALPSSITTGGTGTVQVTVRYLNSPVEGATVICVTGGIVTPTRQTDTTDEYGMATFTVTGGALEETDTASVTVQATIDGYTLTGSGEASISVANP